MKIRSNAATMLVTCGLIAISCLSQIAHANTIFFVSATGKPTGTGSRAQPWDFYTGCNEPASVVPPGSYIGIMGTVSGRTTCSLSGTASQPIAIVTIPGDNGTIDGFGGNTLTQTIPSGNTGDQIVFPVSNAAVAARYIGLNIKIDIETMTVTNVVSKMVYATRGALESCPFNQPCPAHNSSVPVTLQAPTLTLNGSYTKVYGLPVLYSGWLNRQSIYSGPVGSDEEQYPGILVNGTGNQVLDSYIHDEATGIEIGVNAIDPIISGNIMANMGWVDANGFANFGKELYSAQVGTNITQVDILNMFMPTYGGLGVYIFSTLTEPPIPTTNFSLNTFVDILVQLGGYGPINNLKVLGNSAYGTGQLTVGDQELAVNSGLTFESNLIAFNQPTLFKYWTNAVVEQNTFCNPLTTSIFQLETYLNEPSGAVSDYQFVNNSYCNVGQNVNTTPIFDFWNSSDPPVSTMFTFPAWQALGYDANSTTFAGNPASNAVMLLANKYNLQLASAAVFNWQGASAVAIDLTQLNWPANSSISVLNAENVADPPVVIVANGQVITVPMTGWTMSVPIGATTPISPATYPNFGAFTFTKQ